MKRIIWHKYIFIFWLMACVGLSVKGQDTHSSLFNQDFKPITRSEFSYCFDLIQKNRQVYNAYNDSVFLIHDHTKWVNFFKRRSIKIHQIHDANAQISKAIDRSITQYGDSIPLDTYRFFFDTFRKKFVYSEISEPFGVYYASNLLERCGKNVPDSLKGTNLINLWRLFSFMQMRNLVQNAEYMAKAYQCGLNILSDKAKKYPYYDYAYPRALEYMCKSYWLARHLQTIDEYRANFRRLDDYLAQEHPDSVLTPALKARLIRVRNTKDEALVRNTYLLDSTSMDKQEADSIMREVIKRNLANPNLSSLSKVRTAYMQMAVGQITAKEAREQSLKRYKKVWKQIKDKRLDAKMLDAYLQPFYTFFYLNHKAEISEEKKRTTVTGMCNDILHAFMNRNDQQENTDFVRDMNGLFTYKFVARYLTPKQMLRFFNRLNVATQVTTYAHTVHVAAIADVLTKSILKYQPELFVGMLGLKDVEDVKRHQRSLSKYVHEAAYYHDVGKSCMVSVVNTEFRPLTKEEVKILKYHPTMAMQYFKLIPQLAKYRDTTLGHHKWYNGQGGYPEDFDNTKSPVRFIIDIVTLSDCLQAATEKVARNYRYGKKFDTVMEEFRKGAGIQYNPDLVKFIDCHPDVAKDLDKLIEDGWPEIYYRIYSKFFGR